MLAELSGAVTLCSGGTGDWGTPEGWPRPPMPLPESARRRRCHGFPHAEKLCQQRIYGRADPRSVVENQPRLHLVRPGERRQRQAGKLLVSLE